MKCVWRPFETAANGKVRYRCARCGQETAPTGSTPDRIFADPCTGKPSRLARLVNYLAGLRLWRLLAGFYPAPGNVLKFAIYHATAGRIAHGIGCEAVRVWMNTLGWRGCLKKKNRRAIVARLREQAAAEGYSFTHRALIGHAVRAFAHATKFYARWFFNGELATIAAHWLQSRIAARRGRKVQRQQGW